MNTNKKYINIKKIFVFLVILKNFISFYQYSLQQYDVAKKPLAKQENLPLKPNNQQKSSMDEYQNFIYILLAVSLFALIILIKNQLLLKITNQKVNNINPFLQQNDYFHLNIEKEFVINNPQDYPNSYMQIIEEPKQQEQSKELQEELEALKKQIKELQEQSKEFQQIQEQNVAQQALQKINEQQALHEINQQKEVEQQELIKQQQLQKIIQQEKVETMDEKQLRLSKNILHHINSQYDCLTDSLKLYPEVYKTLENNYKILLDKIKEQKEIVVNAQTLKRITRKLKKKMDNYNEKVQKLQLEIKRFEEEEQLLKQNFISDEQIMLDKLIKYKEEALKKISQSQKESQDLYADLIINKQNLEKKYNIKIKKIY